MDARPERGRFNHLAATAGAACRARNRRRFYVVFLLTAGCVPPGQLLCTDGPPTGTVCQVAATWQREIVFTADPAHGGAPTPGLAGRVYFFGPRVDFPLAGDGTLIVDLYDGSKGDPTATPVPLEEWRIDKATLGRLIRRDTIGWGYTVFLPWGTYRPDLTQVRLRARYEPPHGAPIYSESTAITLENRAAQPSPPVTVGPPRPAGP